VALHVLQSRYLHYNQGAFVSDGRACLVDPGILPDEVAALVHELGDAEIRYVVLTHADWDHVLGPEHLPRSPIVTHASFGDDLDTEGIRAVLSQLESSAGVERERPFVPPVPDETFTDTSTLRLGDIELQLAHAPGHSASMVTIYESSNATLWAADLLSDVEIPSIIDDLGRYERTLAGIGRLELTRLVPGHGSATDDAVEIRRRLDEDLAYLVELRAQVAEAVTAGRSLAETVALGQRISLRRSEDDATTHRLNLEKVYADLGGDADPEEVGFARAWKDATRGRAGT
jgi:hydroxyacylglutathione hydrolase